MHSCTPERPAMRDGSTRPSFPTTPTVVRWRPGRTRASYPISSMAATTCRISSSVAPWRMTTSMVDPQPSALSRQLARRGGIDRAPEPAGGRGLAAARRVPQAYPYDRRHPRLLHRHPVHRVRRVHGARVVGDHDELGLLLELVQQPGEP